MKPVIQVQQILDVIGDFSGTEDDFALMQIYDTNGKLEAPKSHFCTCLRFVLKESGTLQRYIKVLLYCKLYSFNRDGTLKTKRSLPRIWGSLQTKHWEAIFYRKSFLQQSLERIVSKHSFGWENFKCSFFRSKELTEICRLVKNIRDAVPEVKDYTLIL